MDNYLKKHISIVNKNNQIIVRFGKNICNGIFCIKFSKNNIKNFFNKLSENFYLENCKTSRLKIYSNYDFITEIDTNNYKNNYSYNTSNYEIISINDKIDIQAYIFQKINYDDNLLSIYEYDNIIDTLLYTIEINNIFTLNIYNYLNIDDNEEEYFTINIIIKKPTNHKIINEKINELINLLNS